jgi:putative hydrolase of the HAD superfamily
VSRRRLRLVTFDLDDTLWDVRPVLTRAEAATQEWLRTHCPPLAERFDSAALAALRMRLLAERPALRHHISELRREAMRTALLECGYAPAAAARLAAEAFEVFHAARHRVEPFASVEACLAKLAGDYVLGVLTNGNADVFRIPLGRYFRFALRAESLGASKPDPAHFRAALREAGVEAGDALHVGDHPEHDIEGALAAGLRAAWFNPGARPWPGAGAPAHAEFGDFAELPALLRALDEGPPTG